MSLSDHNSYLRVLASRKNMQRGQVRLVECLNHTAYMLLTVQGSCSILHNHALGFTRDIKCCYISVACGCIGSAIFGKDLVVFTVVCLCIGIFLVCGGGACVFARRHGNWIGTRALR